MSNKEELIAKLVSEISAKVSERLAPNIPSSVVQDYKGLSPGISPVRAWFKYQAKLPMSSDEIKTLDALQWATDKISIPLNLTGQITRTDQTSNVIPTRIAEAFVEQLGGWNAIRDNCNLIQTSTGEKIRVPQVDDRSNTAAWLTSSGIDMTTSVPPTITGVTLDARTVSSKAIVIDNTLVRDSTIDLEGLLGRIIAERIGRFANNKATVGSGSNEPHGIVTASPSQQTAAQGTIAYDDLVGLIYSIEEPYRSSGKFMMNKSTIAHVCKIKDSQNRPLFISDPSGKPGGTILGFPIVENRDMADVGASAKPIIFGDMKVYAYREVSTLQLAILRERFIEFNSLGFLAFYDFDSAMLATSTTNAIKALQVKPS